MSGRMRHIFRRLPLPDEYGRNRFGAAWAAEDRNGRGIVWLSFLPFVFASCH